jgi:hypothetical protein
MYQYSIASIYGCALVADILSILLEDVRGAAWGWSWTALLLETAILLLLGAVIATLLNFYRIRQEVSQRHEFEREQILSRVREFMPESARGESIPGPTTDAQPSPPAVVPTDHEHVEPSSAPSNSAKASESSGSESPPEPAIDSQRSSPTVNSNQNGQAKPPPAPTESTSKPDQPS